MHMYRNLVVADHANCAILEGALKDCNTNARGVYGDSVVDKLSNVFVEYFDKGRDSAVAVVGPNKSTGLLIGVIQFSMYNTIRNIAQMLTDIVPHEYAHLLCFANGWDDGHGDTWKSVCMELGGNGETKHQFATVDGRMKNLYEARTDCGLQHWLTRKQMQMAKSGSLMVQDQSGIAFTLTKHNITGTIKKL